MMNVQLPENRRRDEALRRYMLSADTLAALVELMVDTSQPDPLACAVRHAVQNLDLCKLAVRAFGADPYEPTDEAAEIAITPPAIAGTPDLDYQIDLLARDPEFGMEVRPC